MLIVCNADHSHVMSSFIFSKKIRKKMLWKCRLLVMIGAVRVKCGLRQWKIKSILLALQPCGQLRREWMIWLVQGFAVHIHLCPHRTEPSFIWGVSLYTVITQSIQTLAVFVHSWIFLSWLIRYLQAVLQNAVAVFCKTAQ